MSCDGNSLGDYERFSPETGIISATMNGKLPVPAACFIVQPDRVCGATFKLYPVSQPLSEVAVGGNEEGSLMVNETSAGIKIKILYVLC